MAFKKIGHVPVTPAANSEGAGGGPHSHENAIHDNIANEIVPIETKYDLVTTDAFIIEDSEDENRKKSVSLAAIFGAGPSGVGGSAGSTTYGDLSLVVYDSDSANSGGTATFSFEIGATPAAVGDLIIWILGGNTTITSNAGNPALTTLSGSSGRVLWRVLEDSDPSTWEWDTSDGKSAFVGYIVIRGHDGLGPELLSNTTSFTGFAWDLDSYSETTTRDTPFYIGWCGSSRGVSHSLESNIPDPIEDGIHLWDDVLGINFPHGNNGSSEAIITRQQGGDIDITNNAFSREILLAVGGDDVVDPGSIGGVGSGGSGVPITFYDSAAIHDNEAAEISAIDNKVSPTDDDYLIIEDNADSDNKKHITLGQLSGLVVDDTAIHDDIAGEIVAVTEKTDPDVSDIILIEDSEAANVKKRVQLQNLGDLFANESSYYEVIVDGTGPPVAVTNEAEDDWVYGLVPS